MKLKNNKTRICHYFQQLKLLMIAICCMFLCARVSVGASSASTTAAATVVTPITIVKTADLLFGAVIPTTAQGQVVISTSGTRTGTNVVLSSMSQGNAAQFSLTGNKGASFSIVLPSQTSLTGPGSPMQLGSFTSSLGSGGTFNSGGTAILSVGGR